VNRREETIKQQEELKLREEQLRNTVKSANYFPAAPGVAFRLKNI
jgi:hypothetical protein